MKQQEKIENVAFDINKNRSGQANTYFSEIEVTLWHNDNVLDVISILMYLKGKQVKSMEELLEWFKKEFFKSIEKIKL